jgi:7-cyano-7-deazaguanine synthase
VRLLFIPRRGEARKPAAVAIPDRPRYPGFSVGLVVSSLSAGDEVQRETPSSERETAPSRPLGAAVVLLSGGVDSATALAVALSEGYRCHALTFLYGQRHGLEVEAARRVAESLGAADHRTLELPLGELGGSALTDPSLAVPDRPSEGIPATYVPARNTIFLAFALAYAEVTRSYAIYVGVNAVDYSGYPDCRPEYVEAFRRLAALATRRAVEEGGPAVVAPVIHMTKAEIIRAGVRLGVDYAPTLSCYNPDAAGRACGVCDSCRLRRKGFREAGVPDPTLYQPSAPNGETR